MKAMILAAGRGDRMRPLTDTTPKPLLKVAGKPLIQYTIEKLVSAGFTELVINVAYLGEQIMQTLADGRQFGASIVYSNEGAEGLETAGGIIQALPLLGSKPFLVINSDIACDFPLEKLKHKVLTGLAHLVFIPNPKHHANGDFCLDVNGTVHLSGEPKLTFSGIGIYHPQLFADLPYGKLKLRPVLEQAIEQSLVSGEKFNGFWMDIGTPQRLEDLTDFLQTSTNKQLLK
jgi:N-acetyl-alpha-D-muramate 1-phosphate uridylyltransferase